MFADDATFVLEHDNLDSAEKLLSDNLAVFAEWLRINKLSLNTRKTKCMYFTLNPRMQKKQIDVHIDGDGLEVVEQTKSLGVVQNNLRWNSHIEYISKKNCQRYWNNLQGQRQADGACQDIVVLCTDLP